MSVFKQRLEVLKNRIEKACVKVGRDPKEVNLLPISKKKSILDIKEAVSLGFNRFGENNVQEALIKFEQAKNLNLNWCIVGHLQTNKAKYVARFVKEVHSLDRLSLARELHKHLDKEGRALDVLIQVNTSGEPQKSGVAPDQALAFAKELSKLNSLRVKGLMTIAVQSDEEAKVKACFSSLRDLRELLLQDSPLESLETLSMGMSKDLELSLIHI